MPRILSDNLLCCWLIPTNVSYVFLCFRRSPLQCAAYGGYVNCMSVLIEHKADPNAYDNEVCTYIYEFSSWREMTSDVIVCFLYLGHG